MTREIVAERLREAFSDADFGIRTLAKKWAVRETFTHDEAPTAAELAAINSRMESLRRLIAKWLAAQNAPSAENAAELALEFGTPADYFLVTDPAAGQNGTARGVVALWEHRLQERDDEIRAQLAKQSALLDSLTDAAELLKEAAVGLRDQQRELASLVQELRHGQRPA